MSRRHSMLPGLLAGLAFLALPSLAPAQVVHYYHLDAVGNVRVITDQAGKIVERHDYLPTGEECVTGPCAANPGVGAGQPRKFTGKERDAETGLDYFGARYYSSKIGRFTTVDPAYVVQENLVDPQRWNRYAHGRNNPLRYVDPDGRAAREMTAVQVAQLQQQAAAAGPSNDGFALDTMLPATGLALTGGAMLAVGGGLGPALLVEGQLASANPTAQELLAGIAEGLSGAPPGSLTGGASLAARTAEIHSALDPIAQARRTTAILQTETTNIVAGGARDLSPAQRAMLGPGEVAARLRGGHAEMTALAHAQANGTAPRQLVATRPFCPGCKTGIEKTGGQVIDAKIAVWPDRR